MSDYIAKASIEPRDYRVVFLIQKGGAEIVLFPLASIFCFSFSLLIFPLHSITHFSQPAGTLLSALSYALRFSLRSPGRLPPDREFRPDASLWPPCGPVRYRAPAESSSACLRSRRYLHKDTVRYSGKEPLSPADSPVRRQFQIK